MSSQLQAMLEVIAEGFPIAPGKRKIHGRTQHRDLFLYFICTVKEKEDLHPDPEAQSIKDEIFGEYR